MAQRLTQVAADVVIRQDNDPTRVTQESADVVLQPTGTRAMVTWESSDTVLQPTTARIRLTQESGEAVLQPSPNIRLTQAFLEVAFSTPASAYGVWMGATSTALPSALRIKALHLFMAVASVVLATLGTLHGHGYQQLLGVARTVALSIKTIIGGFYSAQVMADQPTLYYRLADIGPTATDSSTNGQDFTWVGTPVYQVAGATLDGDSAVTLGGAPYGQLPHNSLYTPGGSFSCEAWVKTTGAAGTEQDILTKFQASGVYPGFLFQVVNGKVAVYLGATGYQGNTLVNDGIWHHVAMVYDSVAATVSFYRDGVADGVVANPSVSLANAQILRIGDRYDVGNAFNGSLDELAFYMHTVSAARILAHYQTGRTARIFLQAVGGVRSWWQTLGTTSTYLLDMLAAGPAGTIASRVVPYKNVVLSDGPSVYYRLDEANGPAAVDFSGHGNNGTYASSGIGFQATGAVAGDTAASLDGNAGQVSVPGAPVSGNFPNGYSIECWIYPTGHGTSQDRIFMVWVNGANDYLCLFYDTNGAIQATNYNGGGSRADITTATGVAPLNTWTHVISAYNGSTGVQTIYLNGGQSVQGGSGLIANVTRNIGGWGASNGGTTSSDHFHGKIDETAFYPYTLTAAQALAHYNASTNSVYGGAVLLATLAAAAGGVATLATAVYRRFQQALGALGGVGATLATAGSGAHATLLAALSPVVGTLGTATRRFYARLLQAAGSTAASLPTRRVVGQLLAVAALGATLLETTKRVRYGQALAAAGGSAPVVLLQRFYHRLLAALPGGGGAIGAATFRRYPQDLLAAVGGTLAVAFRFTWARALAAPAAVLGTVAATRYRRFLQDLAGLVPTAGALATARTLRLALAALAVSDVGIALVRFTRYLRALLAPVGSRVSAFTGYGYQLALLAVSHSTGALRAATTGGLVLVAQAVGRLIIITNHSLLLDQAMAAVGTFVGAVVRTRVLVLLAQSPAAATLRRLLSLSLVLAAASATQAARALQRILQQTYPWSGLPPLVGIGSPGPYFAIDGDDQFKQPDHFRAIPRPLFGISIRRRPLYSGWPSQEWSWADLTPAEFARLMAFWSAGGPWYTIRWQGGDGALHTARAHMHEPAVSNRANLRLQGVTVSFTEVQPWRTETAPPWAALPWNPLPPATRQPAKGIKLLAMVDQGILAFDGQKPTPWYWLFKPNLPGIYTTALDPHDPTQQTMLCVRQGPNPAGTRQVPAPYASGGSIWRTSDGGQTWLAVANAGLPVMVQIAANPGHIAPTDFYPDQEYWNPQYDPVVPGRVLCLAFYATTDLDQFQMPIYALAICESLDGGASWHVSQELLGHAAFTDPWYGAGLGHMTVTADGRYWAAAAAPWGAEFATYSNICSRDGGVTWEALTGVNPGVLGAGAQVVIDPRNTAHWYGVSPGPGSNLMRSTDAGLSWQNVYSTSDLPDHGDDATGVAYTGFLIGSDPAGVANNVFYLVQASAKPPGVIGGYVNGDGQYQAWQHTSYNFRTANDAWIDPQNPKHFVLTWKTMWYETFNGGASFQDGSAFPQPPFTNLTSYSLEVLRGAGETG